MDPAQILEAKAPALEVSEGFALEDDVRAGEQGFEVGAVVGRVEVERDALFSGSGVEKSKTGTRPVRGFGQRGTLPFEVAAGRLHQHHLGPKIDEELAAPGGLFVAHFDDAKAVECGRGGVGHPLTVALPGSRSERRRSERLPVL